MCDTAFAKWYERGMTRRKAKQIEIDFRKKDCLIELLQRGENRRDSDKEAVADLGFIVGLWNGEKSSKTVGLSVTCGLYSTAVGLGGNCILLNLPEDLGELKHCDRMEKVLTTVAKCWEPDWAGVFSLEAMDTREFNPAVPFVDWMIYISDKMCKNPVIPEVSAIHRTDGIGSLIVLQCEPTLPDNLNHAQKAKEVELALKLKCFT